MISDKKALEAAETIVKFCAEQVGCQNCVFKKFGCDHWNCCVKAFELSTALANKEAKKKNRGWL